MKNTSVSLFRHVLDLIPKREFEEIIMKTMETNGNSPLTVGLILYR